MWLSYKILSQSKTFFSRRLFEWNNKPRSLNSNVINSNRAQQSCQKLTVDEKKIIMMKNSNGAQQSDLKLTVNENIIMKNRNKIYFPSLFFYLQFSSIQ